MPVNFKCPKCLGDNEADWAEIPSMCDSCGYHTTDNDIRAIKEALASQADGPPRTTFLATVTYENGSSKREIYAVDAEDAFGQVLAMKSVVYFDEEDARHGVTEDVPESILLECARPLAPGQHPGTPPLWVTVASWTHVATTVWKWVRDEDEENTWEAGMTYAADLVRRTGTQQEDHLRGFTAPSPDSEALASAIERERDRLKAISQVAS